MAGQVDKSKLGGFSYRISIEVWIQPLPVESLSVAEKGNNEVQKNTDQKDHKSGKVVREEQLLKVEEDNWIEGGHREHMQILYRRAFATTCFAVFTLFSRTATSCKTNEEMTGLQL